MDVADPPPGPEATPRSGVHARARLLACGTSFLLLLVGSRPELPFHVEGASLLVPVALPLLLLATWPRRTPWAGAREEVLDLALGLPLVALALWVDAGRHGLAPALGALALVLGLGVLWAFGARRAVLNPRTRALQAGLWFLLVPVLGGLELALGFAGRAGESQPGSGLGSLPLANPLGAVHALGRSGGLAPPSPGALVLSLGAALLVGLAVEGLRRREGVS